MRKALPESELSGEKMIHTLRAMDFYKLKGESYVPLYTRDELTEALHEQFDFHTDHEMVTLSAMRKIISQTKKQGHMTHLLF